MKANYRKNNDKTRNSSTYHKKDSTNVRAILKEEANKEIKRKTVPVKKLSTVSMVAGGKKNIQ